MFARFLIAGLGVMVLSFGAVTLTVDAAEPAVADPQIATESPQGYYLFRNEDGLHLRTHGDADGQHFVAVLHTDGQFVDVRAIREEQQDGVAVLNGGHTLVVNFTTYQGIDGVDFRIRGADKLGATFFTNEHLTRVGHIFIGSEGHHPAHNPMVWGW